MKTKDYLLLCLFIVLVLIVYFPTRHAGFILDFLAWQNNFNHGTFIDAFSSFGYRAQQQFFLLLFYSFYKLFHLQGFYWYVLFSGLHALNGWLLMLFFLRLFSKFNIPNGYPIAIIGTLLFLLSPYNAEVVVWKVCLHYLLTASFLLLIFHCAISWFETSRRIYLITSFICFFLAMFSFEWSIIIPVATALFAIFYNLSKPDNKAWLKKSALLIAPQFLLLPLYFLLNNLMFGTTVGHYGQEVHFSFDFYSSGSQYLKYFVKDLLFLRHFNHPTKMAVLDFFSRHEVILVSFLIILFLLIAALIFYRKINPRIRLATLCLLMFFIALTPVSNLYMSMLLLSENDRYGYFSSMFFFMMLIILIYSLPAIIRYAMIVGLLSISLILLIKTTVLWSEANNVYLGLINDFRWYNSKEVYVLNIPDNYHGIWMFRIINEPSALPECLELIGDKKCDGTITDIAQYNMMAPGAGVTVSSDSLKQIHVMFNQWGNWWWRNAIGAGDYETEKYAVHFVDNGYVLRMKELDAMDTFIYQVGDKWEEFKLP
ncbi:MAG: hypothetical protein H0V61_09540 [Chitinophagales bacterium]|nr:hypothetical protein [Chitinophagales bacterium]